MLNEILIGLLFGAGLFFLLVAAVGVMRFPDIYCRLHVVGVVDTLGVPLLLAAAAVHLGPGLTSAKLALAVVFLYLTSPLVGHLLSRAALQAGVRPWEKARSP